METWNQGTREAGLADTTVRAHETAERAGARAHETTDRLSSRAHETVDQVASVAHRAADRLSSNSEQWLAAKDEMVHGLRDYVRERPIAALAAAVAVGFVLSRLSR